MTGATNHRPEDTVPRSPRRPVWRKLMGSEGVQSALPPLLVEGNAAGCCPLVSSPRDLPFQKGWHTYSTSAGATTCCWGPWSCGGWRDSVHSLQYAVVSAYYLTKWVEVFATKDQTALTIGQLLVTEVISRHGVPRQLLSDRGSALLSSLIRDVCKLVGIHKVNTTAYHPQGDGLVKRFNRTLTEMLSKTVEQSGKDWDVRRP